MLMAGNAGMSKSPDFAADEADSYCVNQVRQFVADMESLTDLVNISDYTLSEQLDIEILKLEEMITCLEQLELQLDNRRQHQSFTFAPNEILYQNSNVMERSRRSGIPVPKRVTPKPHHPVSPEIPIPQRTNPGYEQPVSPPLSPVSPPLPPENGVAEDDIDQVEEASSYRSSTAVKSAAGMFGGQAVIRRIPTPNSRRQGMIPKPPPKPTKKEKFLETNVDDIFDEPMKSLSEINGICDTETYDNVDDIDNIPSYEEFLYGNNEDIKIDNESERKDGIEIDLAVRSDEVMAKSPPLDSSEMDYTILGTISPLNDNSQKGDNSKEEMSFVIGRPASPMSPPIDTGLKRCLSPPYEPPRPLSPVVQVVHPTKRMMSNNRNRALPPLPPSRRREVPPLGIMCEGCNNCLLELKRQALRLMYQENPRGEAVTMPVESIGNLKEKLQVPENGYRFHRNGHCDVCDTHVSQLKQEAVSMVQSIQHAQSETSTSAATSIPQLIGSINLSPRKGVPHVRYGRSGKYSNYLSKSAPIAAQAQAYLEHNVRPWNVPRKFGQMLLRQSQQERGYPQGGDMYAQGQDHAAMAPGYGRPGHYAVSGAHVLSTPYMQQSHAMQMFHPQLQYQQQQQQQQQQHYQQQYHHPQPLQQQQHFSYQPLSHQQLLQQYQHLQPNPPQNPVIHQQPQPYQQPSFQQQYPQFSSQSAPGSPIRVQSPPPRMGRISSPPPSSPSLSSLRSSISPPPSASAAASFFARAAQKLSKKKKRHHQPEPEPPPFPTNYSEILRLSPPPCPPCLLRNIGRQAAPGVGKVKVMLRIVASNSHGDQASSFLTIDTRNKQVTVHDPAASGYATSAAHRKAAMAPKMFAFDAVFSPDDCLTEVCSGSLTEIIQGVVAGADGCVFTYGYSKLGKTYTMIGGDSGPQTLGIVPCAIAWLFKLINDQKDHTGARFSVRVSAVEVSGKQETLKDLLADVAQGTETGVATAPGVYLREDPISGTQLENQSELRAPTADRAAYYLDAALAARTQSEDEGRSSHLLFTLHVYQYRIEKQENKAGLPGVAGGRSRLHLIDLGSSSKSKDPNNVALSLSALGNVIMALLNGQRHVPHRDSKVAQLLRDSLGNISCRSCMIAHVSEGVPHYNESLQVVQLAARIHRMRRRKLKFSTSSDDSSTDGSSIRSRPLRGFRMGTLREDALSDPDYTSSSEQSCDTVIYLGRNGQSLSDRELTDHEGPPRSVPRTNPRLPRRASGSRSSGDEGSNSDSGRSMYRSKESLYRIPSRLVSPVRDVSITGSRQGTPIRDISRPSSRNGTPVRDISTAEMNGHMSTSPPSVSFNLPRKTQRTKTTPPRQEQCYAGANVVDKVQKSGVRVKRLNAESLESEQWIDGPSAVVSPEKVKNKGELWIDGPASFVVKNEPKLNPKSSKISSEELWIDGPREMIAEPSQHDLSPSRSPSISVLGSTKRAHVRSLSAEKKSPSPQGSPSHHHRTDRIVGKPAWPLHDIKERPESAISIDSNMSNKVEAAESRPVSMEVHNGDIETNITADTNVKPFVRDWVEKHGLPAESDMDKSIGFIVNSEEQLIGTLETAAGSPYRKSKPLDTRTKKLLPASSTPKHSPHHSPKTSPALARKSKPLPAKIHVPKSQLPITSTPTKRVTDWLRSVEHNQPEEVLYMEGIVGKDQLQMSTEHLIDTQDVSACSSVIPETTLNDSLGVYTEIDSSLKPADSAGEELADVSFDSSCDTANSQNRESIYEQQVDEQLEKDLEAIGNKLGADDDTFSNASCSKESDSEGISDQPFVETADTLGEMVKSDTIQSIRTLVGELIANDTNVLVPKSDISEKVCNEQCMDPHSALSDLDSKPHLLSRKPDGASNPNLSCEIYTEKTSFNALRDEYTVANALSSQHELDLKSKVIDKTNSTSVYTGRPGEADGQCDDKYKINKDLKQSVGAKPPLPQKPCSKCGYSPQTAKTMSKLCKDCQKMVTLSIKNSHNNRTEKDKSSKHNTSSSPNGSPNSCATKTSKSSKSQSPSQSRLPIFSSKNSQTSSKEAKANRKKEKESKKMNNSRVNELVTRSPHRGHESDSGNDSGIVAMEKTLLSPYATVTKPRTVSHSSSGHGSDNSSSVSADLHSKQGSHGSTSDKLHGGTSSGYESMLRDSENSGSSTAQEESASESSVCDKKKGSKKRRVPSTRRSRSAPGRSSESPETSSSRKSSPSSKNSSLSPSSKAWIDRHKLKEEKIDIKDYDQEDLKRMNRHKNEDQARQNHDKLKEIINGKDQEIPNGKDHYIVDRDSGSWSFDCRFLMCFSCRSKSSKKTDV